MRHHSRLLLAGLMVFAAGARVAEAQGGATASAGAIRYHMQGVEGTTWALAARFELPVRQYVIIEPSFTYFRWQPLAGSKVSYVIPELTFEVQGYLGRVHPYLGSGIGWASIFPCTPRVDSGTTCLAASAFAASSASALSTPGMATRPISHSA